LRADGVFLGTFFTFNDVVDEDTPVLVGETWARVAATDPPGTAAAAAVVVGVGRVLERRVRSGLQNRPKLVERLRFILLPALHLLQDHPYARLVVVATAADG
jgi:hypothetical protein